MTNNSKTREPDMADVAQFWSEAAEEIDDHWGSALFGEQTEVGLFPPVFQFSDNRKDATRMAEEVLEGKRNTMVTPLADFAKAGVGRPALGDMSIVCDGNGKPVALISDTHIAITDAQTGPHAKNVVETFDVIFPSSN